MQILTYPNPILRQKSEPISEISQEIHKLATDMLDTMYEAKGKGLSAIQVGIPLRLFVADTERAIYINPQIIFQSGTQEGPEGCLSFPGKYGKVKRFETVLVRAQNLHGEIFEEELTGMDARCVQHEIEHLDGALITDKFGKMARKWFMEGKGT